MRNQAILSAVAAIPLSISLLLFLPEIEEKIGSTLLNAWLAFIVLVTLPLLYGFRDSVPPFVLMVCLILDMFCYLVLLYRWWDVVKLLVLAACVFLMFCSTNVRVLVVVVRGNEFPSLIFQDPRLVNLLSQLSPEENSPDRGDSVGTSDDDEAEVVSQSTLQLGAENYEQPSPPQSPAELRKPEQGNHGDTETKKDS